MQYLRYCSVTADSSIDFSTLRCRFQISQWTMQTPSILKLVISNITPAHAQQFVHKEYKTITIDAGYQDGHGIIFKGDIKQAIYGRESPTDTIATVYAADLDRFHNYAVVHTTFPPGSTPQQHVNAAIQAGSSMGASLGYIGIDLSTPTFPRAVTLFGMARDVLANIAQGKQATVSYQQGKIQMLGNGHSTPGGAIKLNSTTGLIGMPTQTIQGIFARCLINPAIHIGSQVFIDQKDIQGAYAPITLTSQNEITQAIMAHIATDGLYTVYRIDIDGDTRGNPWYMDLMMVSTSGPPTPGEKAARSVYLGQT